MKNEVKKTIRFYDDLELELQRSVDWAFIDKYYEEKKELMKLHPLKTLFLEVTSRCNAHCEHCGSSCGDFIPEYEITGDEIKKVLKEIYDKNWDTSKIMLNVTGGEPTLRSDICELMKYARKLGYNWGMTTNGMLIDEKKAKELEEAEISSVSISIDGLKETHESFRKVKGSWEKIWNGVKLLQKIPSIKYLQITTCVNKKNINELEDVYKFVKKMGITEWRIFEVDPIGRAKNNDEILPNTEELKKMFNFIAEKQREDNGIHVVYGCSHFLGMDLEPIVRERPFVCLTGITVGSILSNGDIFVCPDVERRPELIQGNIRKDSFTEVWEKKFKPYRKINRTCNEKCKKCPDWKLCSGDAFHTWDFDNNKPNFCYLECIHNNEAK